MCKAFVSPALAALRWVFDMRPNPIAAICAIAIAVALGGAALSVGLHEPTRSWLGHLWSRWQGPHTVDERVARFGTGVATRLQPAFAEAGLHYPPHEVAYLAFKDQRVLEVYGRNASSEPWRYVQRYVVQGASGRLGPKLVEGDHQVPEGVYRAEFLNPNSRFHLSIRLNYPNAFDRQMAAADGREQLGGDIMIHGSSSSVGCLAMGDQAAEDLFVLSALVTKERTRIVVSPTDFRLANSRVDVSVPPWVSRLYESLRVELAQYEREIGPSR